MPREAWLQYLTEYFQKSDTPQIIDGILKNCPSIELLTPSFKITLWMEHHQTHTGLHCDEFSVMLREDDPPPVFIARVLSTIIAAWAAPSLKWASLAKDAQLKVYDQIIKEMSMKPVERGSWYPMWVIDTYKVIYDLYDNRISKKIEKSLNKLKLCMHVLHGYGVEIETITKAWDEVLINGILKS
jgi:hypothetical protein